MTYLIQEIATQKELIVHYDRLKLLHEPPPTSIVLTRDRRNPKNDSPLSPRQHEQILPEFDHDQGTWHYPYQTVPSATTCSRGVACSTPPTVPTKATTSVCSPQLLGPSPDILVPEFLSLPAPTPRGQPLHVRQPLRRPKPHHLSRSHQIIIGDSLVVLLHRHR